MSKSPSLRLEPSRNGQRAGINWANEYSFEAKLGCPGAVAQLGERVPGRHEVTGSSPVGSIPSYREDLKKGTSQRWFIAFWAARKTPVSRPAYSRIG